MGESPLSVSGRGRGGVNLTPPAPFPEREGGVSPSPFRGGAGEG